jgi:Flp pilus assembly protein TadD
MIKNIKVIVLISLMSASICLYSYAQEPIHIKTKSNIYVLINGQKLIEESKYQQAIQAFNTIIKENPQNAEA